MSKTLYLFVGVTIGAAAGLVYDYLFSPATGTKYDKTYRSRLDWALEEGERAADLRELELRREFEATKLALRQHPTPPATPPPTIPPIV